VHFVGPYYKGISQCTIQKRKIWRIITALRVVYDVRVDKKFLYLERVYCSVLLSRMFYTEAEVTTDVRKVGKYLPIVTALIFQKTWNLKSEEPQENKQKYSQHCLLWHHKCDETFKSKNDIPSWESPHFYTHANISISSFLV